MQTEGRAQMTTWHRRVVSGMVALAVVVVAGPASAHGRALGGTAGRVTEFVLPTADSRPYQITAGPDGNLWFTESNKGTVGKITPSGVITEYHIRKSSGPYGITTGPDGNIWFTERYPLGESGDTYIGKLTPDGQLTEYRVPTSFAQPWDITTGPDGALWFTEEDVDLIGRVTTDGAFTEYSTGTCCFPTEITSAGGSLWFTEEQGPAIVRMTTQGGAQVIPYPDGSQLAYGIAAGPDGAVWGTNIIGPNVVRVGRHSVRQLRVRGSRTGVAGLVTGPDGLLWFTENDSSHVGAIDTSTGATVRYLTLPGGRRPIGIAAGPDGNVWFCEADANRIGRVSLS
jgi:streptogramin lyase